MITTIIRLTMSNYEKIFHNKVSVIVDDNNIPYFNMKDIKQFFPEIKRLSISPLCKVKAKTLGYKGAAVYLSYMGVMKFLDKTKVLVSDKLQEYFSEYYFICKYGLDTMLNIFDIIDWISDEEIPSFVTPKKLISGTKPTCIKKRKCKPKEIKSVKEVSEEVSSAEEKDEEEDENHNEDNEEVFSAEEKDDNEEEEDEEKEKKEDGEKEKENNNVEKEEKVVKKRSSRLNAKYPKNSEDPNVVTYVLVSKTLNTYLTKKIAVDSLSTYENNGYKIVYKSIKSIFNSINNIIPTINKKIEVLIWLEKGRFKIKSPLYEEELINLIKEDQQL